MSQKCYLEEVHVKLKMFINHEMKLKHKKLISEVLLLVDMACLRFTLPLYRLCQVSKCPLSKFSLTFYMYNSDFKIEQLLIRILCFRTLNCQLSRIGSTVSTTPCITINTTHSYSARKR